MHNFLIMEFRPYNPILSNIEYQVPSNHDFQSPTMLGQWNNEHTLPWDQDGWKVCIFTYVTKDIHFS